MSLFAIRNLFKLNILQNKRVFSSIPEIQNKQHEFSKSSKKNQQINRSENRYVYQEFLPDPKIEWRNKIKEKLERSDMIKRRTVIDIPEFYVGSVLAVTISDPHAVGKVNRFVGICILRERCGLRARFILRNVVDHQGVEVLYDLYDPTIQKIEVLRLQKRLDDRLLYLRDALPEYSTFDFDMDPEILPDDMPVPVNDIKVKLKPQPWLEKWERQNLKGVENIEENLVDMQREKRDRFATPWHDYDLVKEYRKTIPEEEQTKIFAEVLPQLQQLEVNRKKMKKRVFIKPKKLA